MSEQATPTKWYMRHPSTGRVEGPFDVVELAGYLSCGEINDNTPVREGQNGAWMPFQKIYQYRLAKELPPGVILRHVDEKLNEKRFDPFFIFKWIYGFILLGLGVGFYLLTLIFRRGRNRTLILAIKALFVWASHGHH